MSAAMEPTPPPAVHTEESHKSMAENKERPSVTVISNDSRQSERTLNHADNNGHEWLDEPPPLNFSVSDNKRELTIAIWFLVALFEAGVLPLILFYSLRWGAHLSTTKNLAIITSLIGSVSGFKFGRRSFYLWIGKNHHNFRPIGAGRWGMDYIQLIMALAMGGFFIPLIIGSSVEPANPRIVAMALPITMLVFVLPLLVTGLLPHRIKVPIRISSFPHWTPLPPLAYVFVEDIVAVDGGGATEFRQAWRVRYEESQVIRHLIRQMSVLWGVSGVIVSAGLLVACWKAPVDTAYGLAYGIPWLWGILTAAITIHRANTELARERREWVRCPALHRARTLPIREGKYDPPAPEGHGASTRRAQSMHVQRPPVAQDPEMGEMRPPARTTTF